MIPLFFGASDRQLYGAYHPGKGSKRRGVVLCHPWGQEYLRSHQSIRNLASRLGETGLHVLRFDWFGSGDSAGTGFHGGDPRGWAQDLSEAVSELKDTADLRFVSLVGLRLAAGAVAQAGAERKDVDRIVLWDPVLDGRRYVRELLEQPRVHSLQGRPDLPEEYSHQEVVEVMGFPLTPSMRQGIEEMDAGVLDSELPPTLLVSTVSDPERYSDCHSALEKAGTEVDFEEFDGPEVWVEEEDFGASGMPADALRRITEWLA